MKRALIVIDVQEALCTGANPVFAASTIIARINHLSAKARSHGVPVIFIQHSDATLLPNSPAWALACGLDYQENDGHFSKTGSDAFHHTELQAYLLQKGIKQLVVCGMQSDFCIDSTVRRALALGFSVQLVADAHSTVDNHTLCASEIIAHHNETLSHIGSYGVRAHLTMSADIAF